MSFKKTLRCEIIHDFVIISIQLEGKGCLVYA